MANSKKIKVDDFDIALYATRNAIEFNGLWEQLNNPAFNSIDFDAFKKTKEQMAFLYANEADMLNVALFGKTAKQWREQNTAEPGNIRDHATRLPR